MKDYVILFLFYVIGAIILASGCYLFKSDVMMDNLKAQVKHLKSVNGLCSKTCKY